MFKRKKKRKSNLKYRISSRRLTPKQFFHKRIIKKFIHVFLIMLLIAFLSAVVFFLFFTEIFNIKEWKVGIIRENAYLNSEEVKNYIINQFRKNKYKKNIFVFDEKKVRKEILEKFPEIKEAKIKKVPPDLLRIYIYGRPINFIFIGPSGVKHFIDSKGISVIPREDTGFLEVYSDFITEEPKFRDKVFSKEEINEMLSVMHKFQNIFGIKVNKIGFLSAKNEIHLHTDKKFKVMLERGKIDNGLDTLKGGLQKIDIKKEKIEYIDLRIAPKMFVL